MESSIFNSSNKFIFIYKTNDMDSEMKRPDSERYWHSDTLYYIEYLESKLKAEVNKTTALRLMLNVEMGAKAALCECSGDMQIIGCPAGNYCIHNQNSGGNLKTK